MWRGWNCNQLQTLIPTLIKNPTLWSQNLVEAA
ncbi:protein of unknown function [Nitrospina watsonii]|uniref:Uncharacterized protein n=1 Tax=Nitrospina watsonii TaxID=1323948 RepID=A0ABM9HAA1_9BACT|nr:protein of unknown function [Nitrospina watsonii]